MKIDDTAYNYLASLYSTQQSQNVSDATKSNNDNSSGNSLNISDSFEQSSEDYYSTYDLTGRMAPPPPPPQSASSDGSSTSGSSSDPLEEALNSLVSSGTLTSDQADAVTSALSSEFSGNAVSPTSDGSASSTSSDPLEEALDSLVGSGTLTQDQADAVTTALTPDQSGNSVGRMAHRQRQDLTNGDDGSTDNSSSDPLEEALNSLVSSGTLTSDQESSILSELASNTGSEANQYSL